jgi:hypothetical protein
MSTTARRILEALEQFSTPVLDAKRIPLESTPSLSSKRKRPHDSGWWRKFLDQLGVLTFESPVFAYVNICNKITPEIHFIYLDNMEMYCIFKTCCIICCLFSTKCCLFHNFIFYYSNNIFFINIVLKFKYLPRSIKVNISRRIRHYSLRCFQHQHILLFGHWG